VSTRVIDSSGDRITHLVEQIGDLLVAQLPVLGRALYDELITRIPELRGDAVINELMRASTVSNLENVTQLVRPGTSADALSLPDPAVEYARRLAQRNIPMGALLRSYRLGQRHFLEWANEQLSHIEPDAAVAFGASRRLATQTFDYIDRVSEGLIEVYQAEREIWLANRNTMRLRVVESLIAGESVDPSSAEAALGYRLRQHHLGLVVWRCRPGVGTSDLSDLDKLVASLARTGGAPGRSLFIPRDGDTAWAWIPLGRRGDPLDLDEVQVAVTTAGSDIRLALGVPAAGERGFRSSYLEARKAQAVAMAAADHARPVTSFTDPYVRTASLLTADLEATRRLVREELGSLAADTEAAERLRATLRTFLRSGENYVQTAEELHMHKNTVRYRVAKAVEARGRPLADGRLEMELALISCEWLGPAVLGVSE
jgi:DNA-binding PucR family transcriptional regulator